ncbi:hypothetical protein NQZ68_009115 [Dissostichus eleginoides]|nr:hypothetical protein NQZ68_009115 [Dissostichus eleginoides]
MRRAVKNRSSPPSPPPWFSPSDRSLSTRRTEEEACPVLLRAGLLHVGFRTTESTTVTAAGADGFLFMSQENKKDEENLKPQGAIEGIEETVDAEKGADAWQPSALCRKQETYG